MAKRVIVVSDSHGDEHGLRLAFEQAARRGRIDAAVFLGDGMADYESVKSMPSLRETICYAVTGNNDWFSQEPQELLFTVNNVKIFACHGHTRYVKYTLDRLWYAAREREAQVVLYGHTHRERVELEQGVYIINPGAVCERNKLRSAYAELMIEDNGFVQAQLVKWEN